MNKLDLHLEGFKCFEDIHLELNNMTLFTGANASGKSSVIQSLLLLKYASESGNTKAELNLDESRYAFDFGNADTLINRESKSDSVTIEIDSTGGVRFDGGKQDQNRKLSADVRHPEVLKSLFGNNLTYFSAERQGPRYEYLLRQKEENNCGCHGENTGNVINANWNTRIAGNRLPKQTEQQVLFNIAIDQWVDYIFPGISVRVNPVGSQNFQVMVRDQNHDVTTNSTNIGFGISYALPILVGALLADKNSWVVVENLHAKAQSNMGYFLGMMVAAGLRVVVETHSEHVVNGVRRAAVVSERLQAEDVNIYFFKGKSESELITIDETGNLSGFPVDFFDQVRQDMLEIINKNLS